MRRILVARDLETRESPAKVFATPANERARRLAGINPMISRLYAFGLSSGIAAVGGILITFRNPAIVYTESKRWPRSSSSPQAVVGGIGWIIGPVLGALGQLGGVISLLLDPLGGDVTSYLPLAFGVLLLITITQAPDGAAELVAGQVAWVRDKVLPGGGPSLSRVPPWWLRGVRRGERPDRGPDPPARREARATKVPALPLVAEGVGVQFGGVRVLTDVSLTVNPGEVVGLIGPNGAGKTTTIDVLSGFVRPREGSVKLGDTELVGKGPSRVARAGLARSFQSLELFDDMTVRDNLRTAAEPRDALAFLSDLVWPRRRTARGDGRRGDRRVRTRAVARPPADRPPYGRRRLVAIARAVARRTERPVARRARRRARRGETKELGELVAPPRHRVGHGGAADRARHRPRPADL